MKYFIRLLLLIPLLVSLKCERKCNPHKEPEMKAMFSQKNISFQQVYAIGGKGNIAKKNGYYHLPVSLLADSVTYIFENPSRTDTLTIYYTRRFFLEFERCGHEVEFELNYERENPIVTTFSNAYVNFSAEDLTDGYIYPLTIYE
jgi:hypothetical protein